MTDEQKLKISLFVPVYNEEKILEQNIRILSSELTKLTDQYELVIVNDNSTDSTSEICKRLSSAKIRVLTYENGPSRRENLGKAILTAKYDFIGFTDVDLATDVSYLEILFYLLKKYDVVLGSRYKGIKPQREIWRLLISKIYNGFMQIYFNSKIKDHQCGFKAFRKDAILQLLSEMGYDYTFKRGWFWDAELLIRAQRKDYNYIEMPVKWVRGEKTTFQFKRELKMLGYVLKLRFRL
jgi:glycosyltransferase involved in cell wall biosynthesis